MRRCIGRALAIPRRQYQYADHRVYPACGAPCTSRPKKNGTSCSKPAVLSPMTEVGKPCPEQLSNWSHTRPSQSSRISCAESTSPGGHSSTEATCGSSHVLGAAIPCEALPKASSCDSGAWPGVKNANVQFIIASNFILELPNLSSNGVAQRCKPHLRS